MLLKSQPACLCCFGSTIQSQVYKTWSPILPLGRKRSCYIWLQVRLEPCLVFLRSREDWKFNFGFERKLASLVTTGLSEWSPERKMPALGKPAINSQEPAMLSESHLGECLARKRWRKRRHESNPEGSIQSNAIILVYYCAHFSDQLLSASVMPLSPNLHNKENTSLLHSESFP